MTYASPIFLLVYRLVLLSEYEKKKAVYALSRLAPSEQDTVELVMQHSNTRTCGADCCLVHSANACARVCVCRSQVCSWVCC
jgi:hypothetical protein